MSKKTKIKVGDRVRFVDKENYKYEDLRGKFGTVMHADPNTYLVKFDDFSNGHSGSIDNFDLGTSGWYCCLHELELVNDDKVVIYRKDNEVIAKNTATGKTAKATCHEDDEFDFGVGAKLALERLFPSPTKEETVEPIKLTEEVKFLDKFEKGKTYIFDKNILKSNFKHECNSPWVDECNGKVVKINNSTLGFIEGYMIDPRWCKEVNLGEAVPVKPKKHFQVGDIVELTRECLGVPKGARGVIVKKHDLCYSVFVDFKIKYAGTHTALGLIETETGLWLTPNNEIKMVN